MPYMFAALLVCGLAAVAIVSTAAAGDRADATTIARLKQHLAEAVRGVRGHERNNLLLRAAEAYAYFAETKTALELAADIRDPVLGATAICAIGRERASADDVEAAQRIARTCKTPHLQAAIYEHVAISQARKGDITAAINTVQRRIGRHHRGLALAAIVTQRLTVGDIAGALLAANKISRWGYAKAAKARAFTEIALAQTRAGHRTEAAESFRRAITAAAGLPRTDIKGNSPQAAALEGVAVAQFGSGDLVSALRTLERIKRGYFRVLALTKIATAQADSRDVAASEATFGVALHHAARLGEDDWRSMAFERIAVAQARAGLFASALATAGSVDAPIGAIRTLNEIALAHATAGQLDEAKSRLREALGRALALAETGYGRAVALSWIADAHLRMGNVEGARHVANRISDEPRRRAAETSVLVEQFLATTPIDDVPSKASLLPVDASYALCRRAAAAARMREFERARALAAAIAQDFRRGLAAQQIATEWSRAGDVRGARAWAEVQTPANVRARGLLGVARAIAGITQETMYGCAPWEGTVSPRSP